MYMRATTVLSLGALLLGSLLWRSSSDIRIALQFIVCLGAVLILIEAARASKYIWASGFLAVAVLFNPVLPLRMSAPTLLALNVLSIAAFLLAMRYVKRAPREETISIRQAL